MTFKPAHKEDRPEHRPGQLRNDVSLGDYIARKQRQNAFDDVAKEKKLTFDEWLKTYMPMSDSDSTPSEIQWGECTSIMRWYMQQAWKAGQENK